jgi:hypothetical protein
MFVCYQTSIERQFEFIQRGYADNPDFVGGKVRPDNGSPVTPGFDPIIGQAPGNAARVMELAISELSRRQPANHPRHAEPIRGPDRRSLFLRAVDHRASYGADLIAQTRHLRQGRLTDWDPPTLSRR